MLRSNEVLIITRRHHPLLEGYRQRAAAVRDLAHPINGKTAWRRAVRSRSTASEAGQPQLDACMIVRHATGSALRNAHDAKLRRDHREAQVAQRRPSSGRAERVNASELRKTKSSSSR